MALETEDSPSSQRGRDSRRQSPERGRERKNEPALRPLPVSLTFDMRFVNFNIYYLL